MIHAIIKPFHHVHGHLDSTALPTPCCDDVMIRGTIEQKKVIRKAQHIVIVTTKEQARMPL
ncbi:hypothetical protein, partial [Sulfoacidibacillus ferrooxidans]|uniref:hypothetical protein n=1 Tax=Sulfoacidibacillus ferrooxidans TaxID=2005001 RepID=UPI001F512ECC